MNISQIHNNNIASTFKINDYAKEDEQNGFYDVLNKSLSYLNESQNQVAINQEKFINGEIEAHELTSSLAESELVLKLASSVTSKIISGVQELTNMQI